MRKVKRIAFNLLLVFLCLTQYAHAQTTSQALVDEGRTLFFNNGVTQYDKLLLANEKFKAAVAADTTAKEANLFYAVSRVIAFALEQGGGTGLETLRDLIEAFGMTRTDAQSIDLDPYNDPPELYGYYNPPAAIPDGEDVRTFLSTPFINLVDSVLLNLAVVNDDPTLFPLVLTAAETGSTLDTEVDYGDVLLMKAMLQFLKAGALLLSAYDMDFDIRELVVIGNAGNIRLQRDLLNKYQNFLTLRTDGSTALTSAKNSLISAINNFRSAYSSITAENDDQIDDLFSFGSEEEMYTTNLSLNLLTELQNSLSDSLSGNRPITLTTEKWQLTDLASPEYPIPMEIEKSASGDLISGELYAPEFIEILDISMSGQTVTILATTDDYCPTSVTLTATLVGGTMSNGTYTVTDCTNITESGSFTGTRLSTETEQVVDLNYLFGNTEKSPLNIRANLPSFSAKDYPMAGTFPEPVMNNIFPGVSTEEELIVMAELAVVHTIPQATITLDGTSSDWQSIQPVLLNSDAPSPVSPHLKIKEISVARDSTYLYWMMELDGAPPGEYSEYQISFSADNMMWQLVARVQQYGTGEIYYSLDRYSDTYESLSTDTSNVKLGQVIEGKIPLDAFHGIASVNLNGHTRDISATIWMEDNTYPAVLLLPNRTSLSGTVSCPTYNGSGKIFVAAYDGPNRNTARSLGSTYIDSPGTYTISSLPVGVDVYLFSRWDKDNNGIRTFGDYTIGSTSGPVTIQSGGSTMNLTLNTEIDDSFILTKPGKYRVFGSNTYIIPTYYTGPSNPNDVYWSRLQWEFIGEAEGTDTFATTKYYANILIIWHDDYIFHFDSIEDVTDLPTSKTAFATNSDGSPSGYSWISTNLVNFDYSSGWGEPYYFKGFTDGLYASSTDYGFSLFTMPTDSLGNDTPRQIKVTVLRDQGDDSDLDGIPNSIEDANGNNILDPGETDPYNYDTDGDGLWDGVEDANKNGSVDEGETDPRNSDSDGDGTMDGNDDCPLDIDKTSPGDCGCGIADADSNSNGIADCLESDLDNDGMPDGWEIEYFGNTLQTGDQDFDGDGFSNLEEYLLELDPTSADAKGTFFGGFVTVGLAKDYSDTKSTLKEILLDGKGKAIVLGDGTESITGTGPLPTSSEDGTYLINPDGSGKFMLVGGIPTWRMAVDTTANIFTMASFANPNYQDFALGIKPGASCSETISGTYNIGEMTNSSTWKSSFIGIITFDQFGGASLSATASRSDTGGNLPLTDSGTYTITSDCALTLQLTAGTYTGAISQNENTLVASNVDAMNEQGVLVAVKTSTGFSNESLAGTFYMPTIIFNGSGYAAEFNKLTFNGAGSFIAKTTSYDSISGTTVTTSSTGTYTVNTDGTTVFVMNGETSRGALSSDGQAFVAARVDTQTAQALSFAVKATPSVADDTDGDGTPDTIDECPYDPYKITPGIAGCGNLDTTVQATTSSISAVPAPQVFLEFQEVSTEGDVSATPTVAPSEPSGFSVLGTSYDIDFTGGFTSPVTVCINYDENEVRNENKVKLYHFDDGTSSWEDITSSVDTIAKKVCGQTDSFSTFTLAQLIASLDVDGDNDADANDGVMILRRLLGLPTVTTDIVLPEFVGGTGVNGSRTNAEIVDVLRDYLYYFDFDGSSASDASDGVMALRYLLGLPTVTNDIVLPGGVENSDVRSAIDYLMP